MSTFAWEILSFIDRQQPVYSTDLERDLRTFLFLQINYEFLFERRQSGESGSTGPPLRLSGDFDAE
jgi:hypothetical protein